MRDSNKMKTDINIEKAEWNREEWEQALFTLLPARSPYHKGEKRLTIGTVTGRILGIPYDEFHYYMRLHGVLKSPEVLFFSKLLNDSNEITDRAEVKQTINRSWEKAGLSGERLVNFLDEEGWMPTHHNMALHYHLRQSFAKAIEVLKLNYPHGFANPDFHQVLEDMVHWLDEYFKPHLLKIDVENEMPHIIWYGEASKSQLYFLYFLMLTGCDVLIFHPEGKDQFAEIDPDEDISFIYWHPAALATQPLRKNELERLETVAYQSSRQLDVVLHQQEASIYKPWQFHDHLPQAVTLKTTYDELFLIAREFAYIRPGFHAEKTKVEIPNLFAKISGVSADRREYWKRMHALIDDEQAHLIRHFPFTEEESVDYTIHYVEVLNKEGNIDPGKLKQSPIWLYKHLPPSRQSAIAHAIARMCAKPKLLAKENETLEDVRLYLFTQVTNLSEEGLRWFQAFDYAQTVPRLILYHTEKSGRLIRSDAAKLLLLNELGFDLFVYNPAGYASIEDFIDEEAFDIHVLDEMAFELNFKRPSIFKKIFYW